MGYSFLCVCVCVYLDYLVLKSIYISLIKGMKRFSSFSCSATIYLTWDLSEPKIGQNFWPIFHDH